MPFIVNICRQLKIGFGETNLRLNKDTA